MGKFVQTIYDLRDEKKKVYETAVELLEGLDVMYEEQVLSALNKLWKIYEKKNKLPERGMKGFGSSDE